jgi:cell division septum initiation protein DivIVA
VHRLTFQLLSASAQGRAGGYWVGSVASGGRTAVGIPRGAIPGLPEDWRVPRGGYRGGMSFADARSPAAGGEFSVTRRGYSPEQVDEYLRYLDAQILLLAADRDALVEHRDELVRQVEAECAETDRLRVQLRRLNASPHSTEDVSGRLCVMLELATEEVTELRARVGEEARGVAQAEIGRRRNEQLRHRLDHERDQLATDQARMREMLAQARRETDRITVDAIGRAEDLVSAATNQAECIRSTAAAEAIERREQGERQQHELDARAGEERARFEREFTLDMASRRAQAEAALEQNMTSGRAAADQLLAQARGHTECMTVQTGHIADALCSAAADSCAQADRLLAEARAHAQRSIEQRHAEGDRLLADARARAEHITTHTWRTAAELSHAAPECAGERREIDARSRLALLRGVLDREIARLNLAPSARPAELSTQRPVEPTAYVPRPRQPEPPRLRPSATSTPAAPAAS